VPVRAAAWALALALLVGLVGYSRCGTPGAPRAPGGGEPVEHQGAPVPDTGTRKSPAGAQETNMRMQPRVELGALDLVRPTPPEPGTWVPPQYDYAVRFVEGMERFQRESGISEERMQAVLLALYDFQEVHRYRMPRWIADPEWGLETAEHGSDAMDAARAAIREILTPDEYKEFEYDVLHYALVILMIRQDLIAPQEQRTGSEP
jgi:hypothetical protein